MKKPGTSPKTLKQRIRWLFTKDGYPALAPLVVGIVIGFFLNGPLGLILATAGGFAVLYFFKRLPIRLKPWQALTVDLIPILAKIFFFMIFLLPVASYLTLPSGHTPNTLPKYVSIIFALPKNLFSKPGTDVFPGFCIIVLVSIVLMFWGALNLNKKKNWLLAFFGLLLYTFSPTITSAILGDARIRIIMSFFSTGYYLAWLGLILILVSKVLPRLLKVKPDLMRKQPGILNILPPVIAVGVLSQLYSVDVAGHMQFMGLFDFESTHHFIAGIFSGGTAAFGSAAIVDEATEEGEYSESDEAAEPEKTPPPPEPQPGPKPPVPSTDPEDEPGTTIQDNGDGTMTKRRPDGTWATKYSDGTIYGEGPNGEKAVYYPDGTSKEWTPEGGLQVTHPNGDLEITTADGVNSSVKTNEDGSIDIKSGYGGDLHIPKEGNPEGSLTTANGDVITLNPDGTGSYKTDMGAMQIDKDGNMSGTLKDDKGNRVTIKPDGSFDAETEDGDTIKVDAEGLKAKFKDGSFLNTDASGTPTSGHFKNNDGSTVDINTDDKGTIHIKDNQGNSADINQDGSGTMKGSDGSTASQDANGNATATNAEGTTWTAKNDGTGTITDKKGNRLELGKDGSVTVKETNGKTTVYTPDQLNQMQAQQVSGNQPGNIPNSPAGGI